MPTEKQKIAAIRRGLKALASDQIVVRTDRDGWIQIGGSGEGGQFTVFEDIALREVGLTCGPALAMIAPSRIDYWYGLFAEATDVAGEGETQ